MDWEDLRQSSNVEDRRGAGSGFGIPGGGVAVGGGASILVAIVYLLFGGNLGDLLGGSTGGQTAPQTQQPSSQQPGQVATDDGARFARAILGSTEDAWTDIFAKAGQQYQAPKLVLFSGTTRSGCGGASSETGPFYCPRDSRVYLDLDFFNELQSRFGAGGDFAYSYVIAHEVGHHVQNLLGTSDQVERAQAQARSQAEANQYSVRLELQADCYAGVWANNQQATLKLTQTDVQEAVTAAEAIGDDALQKRGRGYVVPDSFTHGSSAQRERWFLQGLKTGSPNSCNTFKPAYSQL